MKNNIKYIFNENKNSNIVVILFLINIGSRIESNGYYGIAHFLEHLFFKGSSKYTNHHKLLESINLLGGNTNAFTSYEYTGYYIAVPKNNYIKALQILHNMIFHSLLLNNDYQNYLIDEINKEKSVVINENKKTRSNPMNYVSELNLNNIFKNSNMKYGIGGLDSNIENFTLKKVQHFLKSYYTHNRFILSVSGNFNKNNVFKHFPIQNTIYSKNNKKHFKKINLNCGDVKIYKDKFSSCFICLGFPLKKTGLKNDYIMSLLSNIIANNMLSLLFTELREKHGLVYFVKSDYNIFKEFGVLQIYCGTYNDKKSIEKTLSIIFQTLNQLKQKNFLDNNLIHNIKEYIIGHKIINKDNLIENTINNTIDSIYYNKTISISKMKSLYKNISKNDLIHYSNILFNKKNCSLTLITDKNINTKKYLDLL